MAWNGPAKSQRQDRSLRKRAPGRAVRRILAPALAVFAMLAGPAGAFASTDGLVVSDSISITGDEDRTEIVIGFQGRLDFDATLLDDPERLVIDLPPVDFRYDEGDSQARGLVQSIRYGTLDEATSRIVIVGRGPFDLEGPTMEEVIGSADGAGGRHELRFALDLSDRDSFAAAVAEQQKQLAVERAPRSDRVVAGERSGERPFTIVIDPGHGGIDGGAEGLHGTPEKTVTLAFGLELRSALEDRGYVVRMTRDTDRFVRLDERVRFARQQEADLMISIHADSIRQKSVRGATVYTISGSASDRMSRSLAAEANQADAVAGLDSAEENEEVLDILADLARRETKAFSIRFARSLVGELSDRVEMINNPHRYAGFRVLTAPDVPSVLLELGYLSNEQDEKLLLDPQWRARAAGSVIEAISLYARAQGREAATKAEMD